MAPSNTKRESVPFVARGAGTGLSGGATPIAGGVVVTHFGFAVGWIIEALLSFGGEVDDLTAPRLPAEARAKRRAVGRHRAQGFSAVGEDTGVGGHRLAIPHGRLSQSDVRFDL